MASNSDPSALPVSHPIDSDATSLLTLPGEIRNAIYEALFLHEYPIRINESTKADTGCNYIRTYKAKGVYGLPILQTCRQIYYEASGVLYHQNEFFLCLLTGGYNNSPVGWAMGWLDSIRSQAMRVRIVQISCNSVAFQYNLVDVLPLLRYAWNPEYKDLGVTFFIEDTVLDEDSTENRASPFTADRTAVLNSRVTAILNDSTRCLKKYSVAQRLLQSVRLILYAHTGYVHFCRTDDNSDDYCRHLLHVSDTGVVQVEPPGYETEGIMKIIDSTGASRRLMDMVLPLHEQITADLSKRALAAQFPNLLYVSSRLRACAEQFFSDNEFIPTVSTREPRATFHKEMQELRNWYFGEPDTVHMRFELVEAATLDDVRFDGLALALATTNGYYHFSRARLHIEITHSDHGEEPIHSYTMLLEDVENSTVAFILQLLEEHPEYMKLPCPNIWVNGRGEAREATWNTATGSPSVVVNHNADVGQTITQKLAQELAQKYREKIENDSFESEESDESEELEGLQSALASLCYRY